MKTTKVTDAGQVQIPVSIRDELDFDPGGTVHVHVEDGRAVIRRIGDWESMAGTVDVPPGLANRSLQDLREAGKRLWAAEAVGARLFGPTPGQGGVR
ncbi:MAG: AbrB/MazE/SpoVT family DNA-binding domain-containing protein [Actinobacteria bacterium]|nr:AbrB/MazE/SpoVT family DNA-binding domain-containing protein [Actinomycetota bacterium]